MMDKNLAQKISAELDVVAKVFGDFQKKSQLLCPEGCGKCCFNPEVSCAPYELLPLAIHLLENNLADKYLDLAISHKGERCVLLQITDESLGNALCSHYKYRPFVCRAFGVAGRHAKDDVVEYSVCKILKQQNEYRKFIESNFSENEIVFIETWKRHLVSIDPKLQETETPINEALALILEKVLLWKQYQTGH